MKKQIDSKIILPEISKEILDNLPVGAYVINKEGIVEYFNSKMAEISGIDKTDEVKGKNVFKIAIYKKYGLVNYIKAGLKGKPFRVEDIKYISLKGKKESIRHYNGIPIKDKTGKVQKLLCIVEDVTSQRTIKKQAEETERKITKKKLKESEKRWSSLIENTSDIILNIDLDGKVLYINHAVPGISKKEIVGRQVLDFITPEYIGKTGNDIKQVLKTGQSTNVETNTVMSNGRKRWYSIRITPIKNNNEIVSIALVATDISERKIAEEKTKQKNIELKRFNKIMVGRELKMIELKKKIKKLENK